MNWTPRFAAIVIGSGILASLTDWLFAGDWIHRRFTYPEVWRKGAESQAIALTSPLPFLTCAVFANVFARLSHLNADCFCLQAQSGSWGPSR